MSKVFFSTAISLDGYSAGANGGAANPLGDGGAQLHQWMFDTRSFQEMLGIEGKGETGKNNDILMDLQLRTGANIIGKRMFDEGEHLWPEDAPFHTPVYVLTHEQREPWTRNGGTTFFFTSATLERVLQQAKHAAGDKDVRITGGANVIQQYLNAGLVDEFTLHIVPVMLGSGVRLFDNMDHSKLTFELVEAVQSAAVSHMRYKVGKK